MNNGHLVQAPVGGAIPVPDGGTRDTVGGPSGRPAMDWPAAPRDPSGMPPFTGQRGGAAGDVSRATAIANDGRVEPVAATCPSAEAERALRDLWWRIDAALSPVIGHGGGRSVYLRSLQRATAIHPWLAQADTDALVGGDVIAWRPTTSVTVDRDAVRVCNTLLRVADRVLAGLVGPALTTRLLEPVWRELRLQMHRGAQRRMP